MRLPTVVGCLAARAEVAEAGSASNCVQHSRTKNKA